jgi:hypothetical protein
MVKEIRRAWIHHVQHRIRCWVLLNRCVGSKARNFLTRWATSSYIRRPLSLKLLLYTFPMEFKETPQAWNCSRGCCKVEPLSRTLSNCENVSTEEPLEVRKPWLGYLFYSILFSLLNFLHFSASFSRPFCAAKPTCGALTSFNGAMPSWKFRVLWRQQLCCALLWHCRGVWFLQPFWSIMKCTCQYQIYFYLRTKTYKESLHDSRKLTLY